MRPGRHRVSGIAAVAKLRPSKWLQRGRHAGLGEARAGHALSHVRTAHRAAAPFSSRAAKPTTRRSLECLAKTIYYEHVRKPKTASGPSLRSF
jgi:hypothetical protein